MALKLRGVGGPAEGSQWLLHGPRMTIGRESTCDIFVADPKISRVHAEIALRDNDQFFFIDHGSTNGSFVDGERVSEALLREDQRLRIGNSEFLVMEAEITSSFGWDETQSSVTASISVDRLLNEIDRSGELIDEGLRETGKRPSGADGTERLRSVYEIAKNLHTIYDITHALSTVRAKEDILQIVVQKIFEMLQGAQRCCILLRKEGTDEYLPAKIQADDVAIGGEIRISRSIFQRAIDEKLGILSVDTASDRRFNASESIVDLQLRSCMCAPMIVNGEPIGGIYVDNLTRPAAFSEQDLEMMGAIAQHAGIVLHNAILFENIQSLYHQSILSLINTIEAKDPYTMGHTQRTMRYAVGIGKSIGMSDPEIDRLRTAAQLHDIGKIGVREHVLLKDSRLTAEEYDDIKSHVLIGVKILEPIEYLRDLLPTIRGHHEKWDGSGYPDGLEGENIALGARVLALADAFDAMTTQRPYNKPFSFQQALERCMEGAGKHFDPRCVDGLEVYLRENSMIAAGAPRTDDGEAPPPILMAPPNPPS